ncbi:lipoprotein 17-related variable surface protein, partial [Mycoplasmopsis pullorum]|uniref:lipoprotein 17-related variable surface protein n=8 Tax=Mycoplasmopsis pullorum TaxID=48003 RepID=UPI0015D58984
MKKSRKIFLSFGGGIITSSLVLVSAINVTNENNWNDSQRAAAEDLKTFIESQKKGRTSSSTRNNLYVPDSYKKDSSKYKDEIIDFAIDENQLQSVYDFFIQLPSFNQINDENSKNGWIQQIKNWFWERPDLYFATYKRHKTGSIEWRFMPNTAITDEDRAAENAIGSFDPKIKDLTTFKTLSEYHGRFNTFEEFESCVLNELQKELKKEVYNAPRAYYDNFVTILKNVTVDPNDSNNLNRNIPQDLSNTLLNWLKYSQELNSDEKARGGTYDEALKLLGDNGLIGINKKITQIREKLATYQTKKSSFDYKFEPEEPEKTDFDNEKAKLTTQLQELQEKLNGLNEAIEGKIESGGWNRKRQQKLNLTTTNKDLATGLSTYIAAEEKLEGLLKYREKVAELQKTLSDSSLSEEQKKHYNDRINSLGKDANNYSELQNLGNEIKNSIEADSKPEKIINKFSLWTNEQQKDPYREQIKNVYKDSTLDGEAKNAKIKEIEQQIFSKMKENANNLIDQTSLGNIEKETYKNLINSENMDENNNPYDFPLVKTITKAKIDNLDSLNQAQKEYFKNKIDEKNTDDATKINAILTKAETVNQKMNDYKNTFKDDSNSDQTNVATIKKSTDYTEADSDKKTTFDTALNQRSNDLLSQSDNLTIDQIDQKITALKQAKEDLNGDENLAEAKKQAKNKLNTTYTYLNDAQKTDAINKIDALTTVNDVNNQDAENKKLDDAMKIYSESPANIETIRTSIDYTQADNQQTLENLITAKENDINKTSGPNLTLEQVNEKTTALNNAVTALNGEERLKAAKDEAIRKINSDYSYLTPKQKEKAIELINSQKTIKDVNNQDTTNKALDSSMKTLKDYISNQAKVTQSNNYTYTTNTLRAAYDGNPTKNNNVKGGAIKEAEDLVTALDTENNPDLMNKATVDALNEKIKSAIDALNGQERYNAEVKRLNELSAATAKVQDSPKTTDTASEISIEEIEFNNDTIPEDTKPVDLNITNRNEATGKLDLNYKYKSTKENLETVQSSKIYTLNNDNSLSTLTEQERLDQLIQDQSVTKTVEFNGTDKKSVAVSDLTKDNFTTAINPANNAKVIIDTITPDPNDPRGAIVTYKLESTKDNLGDQKVVSSKNLTTKITGFMTSEEKEEKSNAASNFVGTADPLKQASEFVNNLSDVNISFDPNDNLDHSNETIVVKSIESWDDRTGTLVANFVVQSNKNGEVVTSELKTITINGYMSEEQRLNNLLDKPKNFEFNGDKPQNKTTVDEVKLSELSGYVPGWNDEGEFIDLISEDKAKIIIDEITERDGQYGAISFKYHLLSTRTDIPNNDIVSKTRTYTLSLFQTDGERKKEESNAKNINDLDINVTKNKLASEYDSSEISLSAKDPEVSVIDKEIIGYNDITGEIKISYKLKNNQTNDESETKEIILGGFKTESQRLNELLDSLSTEDINFNGTKKDQLPSVAPANNKNNYSYDETKKTTNKSNIRINSITPDNQAGENTLNLKLISTKTQSELVSNWQINNFVAPESNNKNLVIDGFRTQVEQDKIDQDIEKQRLNDLSTTLDYPNKDKTIASAALKENFTSNPNTFDNAKLVIDSITEINNESGTLKVNYHFESTKDGMNKVISETHSQEFSGFKIPSNELNNINNLDASFNGDNSKLPSYFDNSTAEKTLSGTVEQDPDGIYNRVVKVTEVVNANDKDGNLTIKYVIVSTNKNDPSDTYTSNEKEVEVPGFKTEEERLEELTTNLDYTDKEATMPSETDKESVTNDLGSDQNAKVVIESIEETNDGSGTIKVKYHFESKKDEMTGVVSSSKEATINGFKTEKQRLNELNATLDYTNKSTTMPSDSNADSITNTLPNGSDADVVIDSIEERKDKDGSIKVKYHLVSSKNGMTNIVSESKEATITGFKTEKERLDDFSATLDYPNKDKTIASAVLKENFTSNPNTFDNAKLVIDSITEINNEAGTLKVNYHFESTKDGMNKVISETHSQEFSGFKIPSKELNNINNLDASFNGDNSKLPSYFDNSTAEKTLSGTVEQDPDGIYNRVVKVTEVVNA